jgi:hypothetical protein
MENYNAAAASVDEFEFDPTKVTFNSGSSYTSNVYATSVRVNFRTYGTVKLGYSTPFNFQNKYQKLSIRYQLSTSSSNARVTFALKESQNSTSYIKSVVKTAGSGTVELNPDSLGEYYIEILCIWFL